MCHLAIAPAVVAWDLEGPHSASWKYHSFYSYNTINWNIPWTTARAKLENRCYMVCRTMWLDTVFTHWYKYHYLPCVCGHWHFFYVFLIFFRHVQYHCLMNEIHLLIPVIDAVVMWRRQWRTHVPFMLLHFTNASCLHTGRLFHLPYSHYSSIDLHETYLMTW